MKKVLVVLVTFNGMKWIERCMDSVVRSSVKADIFIVDNGSTDGTIAYIDRNYSKNVIFHKSTRNLGFGAANNIGLKYALEEGYDYVYLLNQDAWLQNDTLANLIAISVKHPGFGILSPIQKSASGRLDPNFLKCCPKAILHDVFNAGLKNYYEVDEVMAAHWLVSIECLKKTGGFSPSFPHYGEDDNFLARARYHGFKSVIVTSAVAVHDREFRPFTVEQQSYRHYIVAIKDSSNPMAARSFKSVIFNHFFWNAIRTRRPDIIKYMFKFLRQIKNIKRNRMTSLNEGAFL